MVASIGSVCSGVAWLPAGRDYTATMEQDGAARSGAGLEETYKIDGTRVLHGALTDGREAARMTWLGSAAATATVRGGKHLIYYTRDLPN